MHTGLWFITLVQEGWTFKVQNKDYHLCPRRLDAQSSKEGLSPLSQKARRSKFNRRTITLVQKGWTFKVQKKDYRPCPKKLDAWSTTSGAGGSGEVWVIFNFSHFSPFVHFFLFSDSNPASESSILTLNYSSHTKKKKKTYICIKKEHKNAPNKRINVHQIS